MSVIAERIVIDGIEIPEAKITTGIYTYDLDRAAELERAKQTNVNTTVTTPYGTLKFQLEAMEREGNTVYIYGPLRKMFPELFAARALHEWQVEYLKEYGLGDSILKRWNDDKIFTTEQATNFRRGYTRAKAKQYATIGK